MLQTPSVQLLATKTFKSPHARAEKQLLALKGVDIAKPFSLVVRVEDVQEPQWLCDKGRAN
eukprot:4767040-Karenia_brevis.AAC.1